MASLLIFIVFLGVLSFLSKKLKKTLFSVLFQLVDNQKIVVSISSLILYPGTIIHEFSHFIAASILFVPIKNIVLTPTITKDHRVRFGSVTMRKVDPIRRTLVGIAPALVGLLFLYLITAYLMPPKINLLDYYDNSYTNYFTTQSTLILPKDNAPLITIMSLYFLFTISTMLFSSKKDLESIVFTIPILILIASLFYILGFQFSRLMSTADYISRVFTVLSLILILPIILHTALLLTLIFIRKA